MIVNGVIRSYISKSMKAERFIFLVAELIESQLQEWDRAYELILMKQADYTIVVKNKVDSYEVTIAENELATLQKRSPYSLTEKCGRN
ncbi:hypothetical protein ACE38V_18655 [Cytobacillus sp. Hz8]|uniref:hypothetical protein n=1 Tax=Cytobacillus sp. Hz8 TaxID=3347168 RepID=UPI0035E25171